MNNSKKKMTEVNNQISSPVFKVPRFVYWIIAGLFLLFFYNVSDIVGLFLLAFIAAYIINTLALQIHKIGVSRKASIFLALAASAVVMALLTTFVVPPLIDQIGQIKGNLVTYFTDIRDQGVRVSSNDITEHMTAEEKTTVYISQMVSGFAVKYPDLVDALGGKDSVIKFIVDKQQQIIAAVVGVLSDFTYRTLQFVSQILNLILLPILMLYFLFAIDKIKNGILSFLESLKVRNSIVPVFCEIDTMLGSYLYGQIIVMFAMGVSAAIVAFIVSLFWGTKYALFIGCFAGLLCIIPYIGFVVICIVAGLIALTTAAHSPLIAAVVMVLSLIVMNSLFDNLISPRIVGHCVGLHPLATIFSLLSFGKLWGFMGMLLAVPAVAALKIIFMRSFPQLFPVSSAEALPTAVPILTTEPQRHTRTIKKRQERSPVLRIPPVSPKNLSPYSVRETDSEKNGHYDSRKKSGPIKKSLSLSQSVAKTAPPKESSESSSSPSKDPAPPKPHYKRSNRRRRKPALDPKNISSASAASSDSSENM